MNPFVEHRPLLFTVAYEMLGSAADAEDVVQEAWLRWSTAPRGDVEDPRAYAVRIVTRLALNQLRTLSRRREAYVGPWLPEPVATLPDVADDVLLAESVSMAMLVVLDTLGPVERAVFVLREVFGYEYAEIATMVDKSGDAVRQALRRARAHVQARRPRRRTEQVELTRVVDRFAKAASTGDLEGLLDLIAPDVVLVTDGGGLKKAALRPIRGVEKVLRFLVAVQPADSLLEVVELNGEPMLAATIDGRLDSVVGVELADGMVVRLFVVRNPQKLTGLTTTRDLARR